MMVLNHKPPDFLTWAHKQLATETHTSSSIYHVYMVEVQKSHWDSLSDKMSCRKFSFNREICAHNSLWYMAAEAQVKFQDDRLNYQSRGFETSIAYTCNLQTGYNIMNISFAFLCFKLVILAVFCRFMRFIHWYETR